MKTQESPLNYMIHATMIIQTHEYPKGMPGSIITLSFLIQTICQHVEIGFVSLSRHLKH